MFAVVNNIYSLLFNNYDYRRSQDSLDQVRNTVCFSMFIRILFELEINQMLALQYTHGVNIPFTCTYCHLFILVHIVFLYKKNSEHTENAASVLTTL